ncbi:exopolysaccharide biosynthesis polyprenyl glycosylphosphotransferase [Streptomyces leeuwenhoekii]|uniref:Transferase n=2 Tax=Streptomyces leeuwenhoekii TaxID=1437453 RepID=A0A0F7W2C5_STRLW|nr:exopolysaccharide biosynthesis polyprenyl glycosylphosphotransferase [Streptomyces leeuwenhoekii]KMS67137.1 transferase [Streptomyces leeuwenhoekii]CQR63987.1 Putative colanic biosynthesis UDP-glucose lipid carrier transferase [Streptomyces leeuwenhoekii]
MTAESTVPSPAGQPRDLALSPLRILPPRTRGGGFALPARRPAARPASRLPLLAADGTAALLGSLTLTGAPDRPLLAAPLVAATLLLRPRGLPPVPAGVLDELPSVCGRIAVAWLALAALLAAYTPHQALSADSLLLGFTVQAAAGCAGRGAVHWRRRTTLRNRPRAALVIGPAGVAQRVAAAVLRHPRCGVRPVGVVTGGPFGSSLLGGPGTGAAGLPVLGTEEEVRRAVARNGVREVLVVHPSVRTRQAPLLRALAASGCAVWEVDPRSPSSGSRDEIAGFSRRRLEAGAGRPGGALGKRVLDVVVSGVLLLAAGPLLLACAVVLRVSEGPGVVFRQVRVGQDGKPFTLLKFRTHRPVDEHESATRWSVADERRMPWFCRFLRRTSLDELLQLWNVFRGDMSLVGPRPERPYFVTKFSETYPGYAARHRMPAGITGLAQIHGLRGDTSIEDRARFDNAYIDNWSLWQDVCILLRTAVTLVRPTGS